MGCAFSWVPLPWWMCVRGSASPCQLTFCLWYVLWWKRALGTGEMSPEQQLPAGWAVEFPAPRAAGHSLGPVGSPRPRSAPVGSGGSRVCPVWLPGGWASVTWSLGLCRHRAVCRRGCRGAVRFPGRHLALCRPDGLPFLFFFSQSSSLGQLAAATQWI